MLNGYSPHLSVYLHLTLDCNLRCRYCYVGEKRHERMPEEVGRQAIDFFLDRTQQLELRYFGGEPLLEPGLLQALVVYAEAEATRRQRRVSHVVITNGTLLTEELAHFCARHRIGCSLSLDGGQRSQDANRIHRSGRGSFADVEHNIAHLLRYVPFVHVVSVVGPDNVAFLAEGIDYLLERGFHNRHYRKLTTIHSIIY
jgi:uncharacterized protein